ncbi:MAG: acetate/propionate family kinase [Anaerolineaceae bacterium]|nr:acetate/propionate family kinase [Anaerolineaceae bacterium]
MNILVFNCGSSSQNYKLYRSKGSSLELLCKGKAHRVGVKGIEPSFIEHHWSDQTIKEVVPLPDHRTAAHLILNFLAGQHFTVDAVGHRFVHGGELFQRSVLLTAEVLPELAGLIPLAPIHNPNSLSVIEVCLGRMPGTPETLTFDTAFHAGLPESAYRYALPEPLLSEQGLRKYGFHGLSYQYVSQKAAEFLGQPLAALKLVACHLGTGGSSVAAIQGGRSIDTSMGYSPLAGLMMSTRSGDLDACAVLDLLQKKGSPQAVSDLLNKRAGLLGVSGTSSDIRDLITSAEEQDDGAAALAVAMYTLRLKKTIGSYMALLGKVDALLFTDDIGLQNPHIRALACDGLGWAGVQLDEVANQNAPLDRMSNISSPGSDVRILVTPTDEELVIARETLDLIQEEDYA